MYPIFIAVMLSHHVLAVVLVLLPCVVTYKMVLLVSNLSTSQVILNGRVAEELAKAGHNVTMVIFVGWNDFDQKKVKIAKEVTIYQVNASIGIENDEFEDEIAGMIFEDSASFYSIWEDMRSMTTFLEHACRKVVENKKFLEWLVEQRFDLAFADVYNVCQIGLIHYAKIPSWIWLCSGSIEDYLAYYIGVPTIPSFMPPTLMESSDHMNFMERTKSLIGHSLTAFFWKSMFADGITSIFREQVDHNFPDVVDIAKQCPLVMVNSNELYELPRPTLAKVVNIGGVGMQLKDAKPLSPASLLSALKHLERRC